MALLELNGIRRVYRLGRIEVHALRGVSVHVEKGEFVSIMGPSGSGKSTLLNVLGCLDRPTSGEFRLLGKDVTHLSDNSLSELRNRFFGFVFQSFNLLHHFTARENVELPLVYRGVGARERKVRAIEALESLGLGDRVNHRPTELSGGEQQRVALARALVAEPSVILADEPTGNLDSRTGAEIMAIFQRLNEEQGITIIQVTHEESIARHGRRILYMRDGLIEQEERVLQPLRAEESVSVGNVEVRQEGR